MKAKLSYYKKAIVAFLMTFVAGSPAAALISEFDKEAFLGLLVTAFITAVAVLLSTNGPDPSLPPAAPEVEGPGPVVIGGNG